MPWEVVRERMLHGLHERGFDDLHAAHLTVLQYPPPDDVRRPDPEDRRHTRVDLTGRGRAAIDAIREIVREVEQEWAQRLGPDRFAQLRTLLSELASCSADARSSDPLR